MGHCVMNRSAILLAFLVGVPVLHAEALCAEGGPGSGIRNGDVETGAGGRPKDWTSWSNKPATFQWDDRVCRTGKRSLKIAAKRPGFAQWSQTVSGLASLRLYVLTAFIRTENVKPTGKWTGVYLLASCRGMQGKAEKPWYSHSTIGTRDWLPVTHYFTTHADTKGVDISCVLKGCTGVAWFDDIRIEEASVSPGPAVPAPVPDGTPVLAVVPEAGAVPFNGFGAEWDPYLWRAANGEQGVNAADHELVKRRIRALRLRRVRMGLVTRMFEPENDNADPAVMDLGGFRFEDTPANEAMYSVYRHLDVCEEFGIPVELAFWPVAVNGWLGLPNGRSWGGAPNNLEEAGENVSALLHQLIREKKYTCIKELSLWNEPNHDFFNGAGAVDFDLFARYCEAVDRRLRKDGLRKHVALVGSDDGFSLPWFLATRRRLDPIVDKYASHMYKFNADTPGAGHLVRLLTAARTGVIDKPFFFGEFGTGHTTMSRAADVDSFDRALFLAMHAVNNLKAGGSGACYWVLHDMYYKPKDPKLRNSGLMQFGLWAYKDKGWALRPAYHAYGLLTRYAEPGSAIHNVAGGGGTVDAVALRSKAGYWTYLVTNAGHGEARFVITNPLQADGQLDRHCFRSGALPADDRMIPADGTLPVRAGKATAVLSARSLTVLQ